MTSPHSSPEHDHHEALDLVHILEELNERIGDLSQGEKISLGELLGLMHAQGIALCILILALPSFFPGLLPPFPSFLAVPMALLGIQLMQQRDSIWLPSLLQNMKLGRKIIVSMIQKFVYYLNKLPMRKTDQAFILYGRNETLVGVSILIYAIIIFIPLPMTNFLPSVGAGFLMMGCLKQSRFYALIGFTIGYIGVLVGIAAVIAVVLGIDAAIS